MSQNQFSFGKDFQIGLLHLCIKNFNFLLTCIDIIKPEYFEDTVLIWFYVAIRDYYLDYKKSPTKEVLWNEILTNVKSGRIRDYEQASYIEVFTKLDDPITYEEYLIDEIIKFCRRQEVKRVILEVAPQIETASDELFPEIEAKIKAACNVGQMHDNLGIQYFVDYAERLRKLKEGENQKIIPTGITELDLLIKGGLRAKQLGIVIAASGAGKSLSLASFAKRAVIGGFKVVYYTLELSEVEIAQRFDSSFSHIEINIIEDSLDSVETLLDDLGNKYGNQLIIKEYPTRGATVDTIRSHLHQLKGIDFIPDLIIVDYGELLKPLTNYNDEYADQGVIYADLRGIAGEFDAACWSACQVNRAGQNVELLTREHIAESMKKVFIADLVIPISRTREEVINNLARLTTEKNRNGPEARTIPIASDYKRMCFYDPVKSMELFDKKGSDLVKKNTEQTIQRKKFIRST